MDNAEKRIRRDPEFGKYVRPVAIENMIKSSGLKPIVIKKPVASIEKQPSKPVVKPQEQPVVKPDPNVKPPAPSKPADNISKIPPTQNPPVTTQPKPKPQ